MAYRSIRDTLHPQTPAASTYQTATQRWLDQQKQAQTQFTAAAAPLRESVGMFQPGGGYGEGQEMLFRDEARRAGAEATTQQVASGMSSGSLATGTGLRIKRDMATSLAGVEDTRTQFLNQALAMLSNLLGTQAQTTAAGAANPYTSSYMSGMASTQPGPLAPQPQAPSIFGQPPSASTLKTQARYSSAPTPTKPSYSFVR